MARRNVYRVEGEDENLEVEYVRCPVCLGANKRCGYCDGFGDVHPEDVQMIVQTYALRSQRRNLVLGMLVILFLGGGIAGVLYYKLNYLDLPVERHAPAEAKSEEHETEHVPQPSSIMADAIVELGVALRLKQYDDVIQRAEALLTEATLDEDKVRLHNLIKRAKSYKDAQSSGK